MTASGAKGWRRIIRSGQPGPWHKLNWGGSQPLSWCGSKLTGFNHRDTFKDDPPTEGALCQGCVNALAVGIPKAWRRR